MVGGRFVSVDPIDVVIHNAGVLPRERIETTDGFEMTWATHVVGPHLLTRLLRPRALVISFAVVMMPITVVILGLSRIYERRAARST